MTDPLKSAAKAAIAITVGDPRGIGPEIVAKSIASKSEDIRSQLRVICHGSWFADLCRKLRCDVRGIEIVDCSAVDIESSGAAAISYLERAVDMASEIRALVTAPIHKARARAAGFEFPGHTEFLAARLGAERVAMLFAGPSMKVVLATIHVPLAEVPRVLSGEAIGDAIDLGVLALQRSFGVAKPRVVVLGLNPHAGEGGMLGVEERDVIAPAILAARARHAELGRECEIVGPAVPDAAYREKADLFVAMYHDQALIPIKLVDFDRSVNVTLGLPIVRTSPDHGTADDIAGRGVARHGSFEAALDLAIGMVG